MKITIIHGQNRRGSACALARRLAQKAGRPVKEFFLPKDFNHFCTGCRQCFEEETRCPHRKDLEPLLEALDEADLIILASPVYVFHASGPMKSFLDHLGWRWMVHCPEGSMFRKQAVCLCTAAGAGLRGACRDMADSLTFWGVPRVYRFGLALRAADYDNMSDQRRRAVQKRLDRLAGRIRRRAGRLSIALKTWLLFHIARLLQKKGLNPPDAAYWQAGGWLGAKRPWKAGAEGKIPAA